MSNGVTEKLINKLPKRRVRENMTVGSLCGNWRCQTTYSPKTNTLCPPPDHDVNELGHQVWVERGQETVAEGKANSNRTRYKHVYALAQRLPHFDMLHICLTPHVTKSPRHGEARRGGWEEKTLRKCWKWQLTGKRAADDWEAINNWVM